MGAHAVELLPGGLDSLLQAGMERSMLVKLSRVHHDVPRCMLYMQLIKCLPGLARQAPPAAAWASSLLACFRLATKPVDNASAAHKPRLRHRTIGQDERAATHSRLSSRQQKRDASVGSTPSPVVDCFSAWVSPSATMDPAKASSKGRGGASRFCASRVAAAGVTPTLRTLPAD